MTEVLIPPELLMHYVLRVNAIESDIESGIRSCERILENVDSGWEGKAPEKLREKLEEFIYEYRKTEDELIRAEQALRSIAMSF